MVKIKMDMTGLAEKLAAMTPEMIQAAVNRVQSDVGKEYNRLGTAPLPIGRISESLLAARREQRREQYAEMWKPTIVWGPYLYSEWDGLRR